MRHKKQPCLNPKRVVAWGRGIQSTTLAVLAALGHLPPVDAVIAADTQWERAATYEVGEFYTRWLRARGVAVYHVTGGSVKVDGAEEHVHIPFWTNTGGPLQRQCTRHFKIDVVKRAVRDIFNLPYIPQVTSIEMQIGFSLDEWSRIKGSRVKFIKNTFPLTYQARMTRADCVAYLQEQGLPVPVKSACIGCPYRLPSEWLQLTGGEFSDAVGFDEHNRKNPLKCSGSTAEALYIYKYEQELALRAADLEKDAQRERSKPAGYQIPMELQCEEGYCHV